MSVKKYMISLSIMCCLVLSTRSYADRIHFNTANKNRPEQWWFGKVFSIADEYVTIEFRHEEQVVSSRVHVSRILSIYFDDSFEHAYPIYLSQKVEEPIPSNLQRLRRLYLFSSDFEEDYPEVKMYGPTGNRSIKGNIEKYNLEQKIMAIRVKGEDGQEVVIEDVELFEYIRAWVR